MEVRSPNFTVISNSGEKEARRIADQFEQFREVFHAYLPQLRLDLGKPLIIFAVKNEDSLKVLLPSFWEVKGHMHPAGYYLSGEERHYVAVRTDIEGDNPYEIVYHEYTHTIMNLNFQGLPLWMSEGLAELFGNSSIYEKEVDIGRAASEHLRVLREGRLIPIDALMTADHQSAYYNEENRASVFYAESWAIVHYLMMDAEARKRQLFDKFMAAWDASGDQVKAAQATFGDLKRFSQAMEEYAHQRSFYYRKVKTSIHGDPKSYASRELPAAELAANRALFYIHTQRFNEAKSYVEEALQADPNLSLAYESRGLLAYSQHDFSAAETAFSRAIQLNSPSYCAYYYEGMSRMRLGILAQDGRAAIVASFEKAASMNPQFAPAYAALASLYSLQPDTREQAFQAALKSVKLEPGNLTYAINFGFVLLNARKIDDAKVLIGRLRQTARTPADRAGTEALAAAAENRGFYDNVMVQFTEESRPVPEGKTTGKSVPAASTIKPPEDTDSDSVVRPKPAGSTSPLPAPKHANDPEYTMEGIITSAECNADSMGKVTLTVNRVGIKFIYERLKTLRLMNSVKDAPQEAPACSTWKGRRARFYFYQAQDKPYDGELETIQFF